MQRKPRSQARDEDGEALSSKSRGPVSMKAIAEAAGVSRQVVSAVLSGKPGGNVRVGAETEGLVRRIADEMGYAKQWRSAILTSGRTRLIGLLDTHRRPDSPHDQGLVAGLVAELGARRLQLVYAPGGERERNALLDGRFDGVLIDYVVRDDQLELIRQANLPAVITNAEARLGIPAVGFDELDLMRRCLEHVTNFGHRRICFVSPMSLSTETETRQGEQIARRLAAWDQARQEYDKAEAGVTWYRMGIPSTMHVDAGSAVRSSGIVELMSKPVGERPTALIAHDSSIAMVLADALTEAGLRIPDDVSLLSCHNHPVLKLRRVAISAIQTDFFELGRSAGRLLADRVEAGRHGGAVPDDEDDAGPAGSRLLPCPLIARGSTNIAPDIGVPRG